MATRPQAHAHNMPYQLACPDEPVCDTDCTVQVRPRSQVPFRPLTVFTNAGECSIAAQFLTSVDIKKSIQFTQGDLYNIHLEAGDILIMATDGLFDNLWPEAMLEIVDKVCAVCIKNTRVSCASCVVCHVSALNASRSMPHPGTVLACYAVARCASGLRRRPCYPAGQHTEHLSLSPASMFACYPSDHELTAG